MATFTAFNLKLEIANYNQLHNRRIHLNETFSFAPFEPEYLDFIQTTIERLNSPHLINPINMPDFGYLRKKRDYYQALKNKFSSRPIQISEFSVKLSQECNAKCRDLLENGPVKLLNALEEHYTKTTHCEIPNQQLFSNWLQNKDLVCSSIKGLQQISDEILPDFIDFLITAKKWLLFYKFFMPDYLYKKYHEYLALNLAKCRELEEMIPEIIFLKQKSFIKSDLFDCDITKYMCKKLGLSNNFSKKLQPIPVESISESQFFWMNQQIFLKCKCDNKLLLDRLKYHGHGEFKLDYRITKKLFFLLPQEVSQFVPWQKKFPFPWNRSHNERASYFTNKSLLLLKLSKSVAMTPDRVNLKKKNQLNKFLKFSLKLMSEINHEFNILDLYLTDKKPIKNKMFLLMINAWKAILIRNVNSIHQKQLIIIKKYVDNLESYFDKLPIDYFQNKSKFINAVTLLQKERPNCHIDIESQYIQLANRIGDFKLYHQYLNIIDNLIDYKKTATIDLNLANEFFSKMTTSTHSKLVKNNLLKFKKLLDLVKEELKTNFFSENNDNSIKHRDYLFNIIHLLKKSNDIEINTDLDRLLQKNALQYAYRYLKYEIAFEKSVSPKSCYDPEPIYNVAYYLGQHTVIAGLSLSSHLCKLNQLKETGGSDYYAKAQALANLIKDKLLIDSLQKDIDILEIRLQHALTNDNETRYKDGDITYAINLMNNNLPITKSSRLSKSQANNAEIYRVIESLGQLKQFKQQALSDNLESDLLSTRTETIKARLRHLLKTNSFFKRNGGSLHTNNYKRSLFSAPKIIEEIETSSFQRH